jgi:hypothetical protein
MQEILRIIFCFSLTFSILSCSQDENGKEKTDYNNKSVQGRNTEQEKADTGKVKILIEIENNTLTAFLEKNETTENLLKLLPMTITMKDLYKSEKYAELPVKLPAAGARRRNYETRDIGYWVPGNCLVIYYKQTGEIINGLQIIGKINEDVEVFEKYKGTVELKLLRAE